MSQGRLKPAKEVDHIKPKFEGGTDDPKNLQAICRDCHKAKTKAEGERGQQELREQGKTIISQDGWPIEPKRWGFSIPHGLQPAQRNVEIVCGPPCSGKSTYVKERAKKSDKIIDLDEIIERIGGDRFSPGKATLRRAFAWRDMAIRGLCRPHKGKAWLIVSAPTKSERKAWLEALGTKASLTVIGTSPDECLRRLYRDEKRQAVAGMQAKLIQSYEFEYP